jgi:formylglycine-generating enzyme required for sulfatase activity
MSNAWVIVGVSAACVIGSLEVQGQQPPTQGQGKAASGATNRPASLVKPKAPVVTNAEPKVAEPPGKSYTNVVEMELLQVGDFWAGKYEVTQTEYQKVMGSNPSAFGGGNRPVDSVSYNDALEFCKKLTAMDIAATNLQVGYSYTLPTESQWETIVGDASLDDAVCSLNNAHRGGTEPVGSLKPNSLGLYDTRGNVMEFTLSDPSSNYRVLHGGSWADFVEINMRLAFRFYTTADDRKNTFGFRCILVKQ